MRKVALLCSGGDSPGMNSAVYSFSVLARAHDTEVVYVEDGYQGLIENRFVEVELEVLRREVYSSGTLIGSSRSPSFRDSREEREGAISRLMASGVEALVVLGGNGSYEGAKLVSEYGLPVILLPSTIDNDITSTGYTIGFFSALEEIGASIKKIWYTSNSHSQVTFIEVMGRRCSDLALYSSLASPFVDLVITEERIPTLDELIERITHLKKKGRKGIVVVVVERILGESNLPPLSVLVKELEERLSFQVRGCVLGHVQRGAIPTTFELYLSSLFGKEAFESFKSREYNIAIGYDGSKFYRTKLSLLESLPRRKTHLDLIDFKNKMHF